MLLMMGLKSCWILGLTLSIALLLIPQRAQAYGRTTTNMENNEVIYKHVVERLPICERNSICGYLQVNSKGVNQQRICKCAIGSCPMLWDSSDGHSITQGSDQYKFCGKVVENLPKCQEGQTAYSSRTVYSKTTDEKISQVDNIKCICPETHTYEVVNQHYGDMSMDPDADPVVDAMYVCSWLPVCEIGEECKVVSETPGTFLVNRKCRCPAGMGCPSTGGIAPGDTFSMGTGFVHSIHCRH